MDVLLVKKLLGIKGSQEVGRQGTSKQHLERLESNKKIPTKQLLYARL